MHVWHLGMSLVGQSTSDHSLKTKASTKDIKFGIAFLDARHDLASHVSGHVRLGWVLVTGGIKWHSANSEQAPYVHKLPKPLSAFKASVLGFHVNYTTFNCKNVYPPTFCKLHKLEQRPLPI